MKFPLFGVFFSYYMVCPAVSAGVHRPIEVMREQAPLSEVLSEAGSRFGVGSVGRRFLLDRGQVVWPDSRVRPYSLDETLQSFPDELPEGAVRSRGELERLLEASERGCVRI